MRLHRSAVAPLALALGLTGLLLAATPRPQRLPAMTAPAWIEDIDTFARELPKRHADAFHAISRERFAAAVAEVRAKAGRASDDEIIVGLQRAAALIGDAHTCVHLPMGSHRLPITIESFDREYRITQAAPEAKQLLGGVIIRIGDVEVAELERRLRRIIAQSESETWVRGQYAVQMTIAQVLHGLGVIPDAKRALVTVALPAGETTADLWTIPLGIDPDAWPTAAAKTPLFREHTGVPFAFTYLEASKTVYVNFRRYDRLAAQAKALWSLVDTRAPAKIVFDLRANVAMGGDAEEGRKLLVEELKKRSALKAYALVGPRTFGAGMVNALDLRAVGATLAGEPIGEKPNGYQDNAELTLPKSKLVVSYSTMYVALLPKGSPWTVTPEQVIAPSWDDFVAGRDPVLDWVLSQ